MLKIGANHNYFMFLFGANHNKTYLCNIKIRLLTQKNKDMKTYDVFFNDANDSNNKGINGTFEECMNWIESNRNDSSTYFGDYKGGTVSIVCNETEEEVYSEVIK